MLSKEELKLLEENINSRINELFGPDDSITKTISKVASRVFTIGIEEYEKLKSK